MSNTLFNEVLDGTKKFNAVLKKSRNFEKRPVKAELKPWEVRFLNVLGDFGE